MKCSFTCVLLYVSLPADVLGQLTPIPLAPNNWNNDGVPTFIYDPEGYWNFDLDGVVATTVEIRTVVDGQEFFRGDKPARIPALFNVYNAELMFELDPTGIDPAVFGNKAIPDLTATQVSEMLSINGSRIGGRPLAPVDLAVVPEPSSRTNAVLSIILFIFAQRLMRSRKTLDFN